jgi:hypothetical protein
VGEEGLFLKKGFAPLKHPVLKSPLSFFKGGNLKRKRNAIASPLDKGRQERDFFERKRRGYKAGELEGAPAPS